MKKRVVMFSTLLLLVTFLLANSCDGQCVCLPCLPIPAPWWFCQQCRPCCPKAPVKSQPKAEPAVKSSDVCPASPICKTCHNVLGKLNCNAMDPVAPHGDTIPPTDGIEDFPPLPVMDLELAPKGTDEQVAVCFCKLNELRGKFGLPPLKWDENLGKIAQTHSNNMAVCQAMYHSGNGFAENVAFGHVSGESTFEQWHRSAPHLQNMLRGTRVGIARCGYFWTLVIGR